MNEGKVNSIERDFIQRMNIKRDLSFFWPIPHYDKTDPKEIEIALRERIKELNCLYRISQLADIHSDSVEEFLNELVNVLPPSWQYPEITCARIVFNGKTFKKGPRIRKRYRCQSMDNQRIYLVNPLVRVEIIEDQAEIY